MRDGRRMSLLAVVEILSRRSVVLAVVNLGAARRDPWSNFDSCGEGDERAERDRVSFF
jgi:hypothetical protein